MMVSEKPDEQGLETELDKKYTAPIVVLQGAEKWLQASEHRPNTISSTGWFAAVAVGYTHQSDIGDFMEMTCKHRISPRSIRTTGIV
jgi:hypothetical protein